MPQHASVTWPGAGMSGCTYTDTTVRSFRALSDPIVGVHLRRERTSAECVRHAGSPSLGCRCHLSFLAGCGYVVTHRVGRRPRYSVAEPCVADLVVPARSLPADNAIALDRCTRIPPTEKATTR